MRKMQLCLTARTKNAFNRYMRTPFSVISLNKHKGHLDRRRNKNTLNSQDLWDQTCQRTIFLRIKVSLSKRYILFRKSVKRKPKTVATISA